MSENKSCCVSAVRALGSKGCSVIFSGSPDDLAVCLGFIVHSLRRSGIPTPVLAAAFVAGCELAGDEDV